MSERFYAAASQIDITPPVGLPLDGYLARQCLSSGVHDPLYAQLLIVSVADQRLALVTLDVLAVSATWTNPLRQALAATLSTTPNMILISASHTHCGPSGLQNWFPPDNAPKLNDDLINTIHSKLIATAQKAFARLRPVQLTYSSAQVDGIAGDRNHPDRPIDSPVTALKFQTMNGDPLAILFHFACHPTILGSDTCDYSADFPGAARRHIEAAYPGVVCLYLNGAAGDLSSRFLRREQSFAEVERMGKRLAEAVIEFKHPTLNQSSELRSDGYQGNLPFRGFSSIPDSAASTTIADRLAQVKAEGAQIEQRLAAAFQGRVAQYLEVYKVSLGDLHFLCVPGEAFDALAIRARQQGRLVIGYANDYLGYFPTQEAIDTGTYEARSSAFDARADDRLSALVY